MKIEQAIFTSSDNRHMKGYQLVAQSAHIDRSLAKELCRWSPSQIGSGDAEMRTLSYYPISNQHVAIARTVVGGPEYSGRGGWQVVTITAVLRSAQFSAYGNHALSVAQTAIALGWLRLPLAIPSRSLEPIHLPDQPFMGTAAAKKSSEEHSAQRSCNADFVEADGVQSAMELICQNRRLAIIGAPRPAETIDRLICQLSVEQRRRFSFTTGLPLASHRPFQAHFLPRCDSVLRQTLKSESIKIVELPQAA